MKFHCLFEQSGTFKNVFKSYGHEAYDYDILDEYGQTDYKIDLFAQIIDAYQIITEYPSFLKDTQEQHKNTGNTISCMYAENIFFGMKPETDFIIAFFPCTHFCDTNSLIYRGYNGAHKKVECGIDRAKMLIVRNSARTTYFGLYIKLCAICTMLRLPIIIENPASRPANYLEMFSPIDVGFYEKDRSLFGDKFKKPTNFFVINFEMKEKFYMFFDKVYNTKTIRGKQKGNGVRHETKERSEITPRYADNFYKRFLQGKV